MKISTINPGDTIRINLPEYKGRFFIALSVFYNLIEIEIGTFVELELVQKKYKNRYLKPITA